MTLLLVRHPPVAETLAGCCYGQSDVPLSAAGAAMIPAVVAELAQEAVEALVTSDLQRCCRLARAVGARLGIVPIIDPRLRERHFGAWELQRWDAIHAATGDAMLGMIHDPANWQPPGGGESTFALRDRVMEWYASLPPPRTSGGVIVAITHGGPIAALRGTLTGQPVTEWPTLVPPPGSSVRLPRIPREGGAIGGSAPASGRDSSHSGGGSGQQV